MNAKLLFNGKWLNSNQSKIINTPSGDTIEMFLADKTALEQVLQSSLKGVRVMKDLSSWQRSSILYNIAHSIESRKEEISQIITREAGKPISLSRMEVNRAVLTFTLAAEEAKRLYGEVIPLDIDASSKNYKGFTQIFPIGIVLAITPFNFPLNLVAHKVAPAIASGNVVIIKPSPQTPVTACLLGEIALQAGLPPEALSIVHCENEEAETLAKDDRINLLSFTGSADVGWYLKKVCGKKKVVLELGGNAAAIVSEDADLNWACGRLALGAYAYSGQICISVQRIFVHTSIFEKFLDKFLIASEKVPVGDLFNESTLAGPMISKEAADRVEEWLHEAFSMGAQYIKKGKREGNIIHPTILIHTKTSMKVHSEEIFGPVIIIEDYADIEDAIAKVNDTKYGLQASIFTNDVRLINKAVEEINVGGLIINDYPTLRIDNMPYGGIKASGFGKEGLKYAIEEMTEKKMIVVRY